MRSRQQRREINKFGLIDQDFLSQQTSDIMKYKQEVAKTFGDAYIAGTIEKKLGYKNV